MTISQNKDRRHVLCCRCKVPANLRKLQGQFHKIVCPKCGATEPYAALKKILAQGMGGEITKMLASVAARSKAMKFTPGRQSRRYKFFLDLA